MRIRVTSALVLALGLVLCLAASAPAAYTWTSTGGPSPDTDRVTSLSLDEAHDILYAGMQNGEVYRYQSGAWSSTGGPSSGNWINDIEYDPVSNTLLAALYVDSNFEVWTFQEGGAWTLTNSTIGNANPSSVASDGAREKLYAGSYGGEAWEYDYSSGTGPWASIGNPMDGLRCMEMDAQRHILYAGGSIGEEWPPAASVYRYDGSSWSPFGAALGAGWSVQCMDLDSARNILYAGTWTGVTGEVNVFRRNIGAGGDWVGIGTLCGGPELYSLSVDETNDTLYALAYDGHAYKNCTASSGSTWVDIGRVNPNSDQNSSLQYDPNNARLYCGSSDGLVYRQGIPALTSIEPPSGPQGATLDVVLTASDGAFTNESKAVFSGDGVDVNSTTRLSANKVKASITIEPETYLGPRNAWVKTGGDKTNKLENGFTVTQAPPPPNNSTCYLAEGTNAWGFSTYITVMNPNNSAVDAKLTCMDTNPPAKGKGIVTERTIALPANSQTTVSSMADIGEVDFSTRVECLQGKTIAADRTMFWTGELYEPSQAGYHSSIGATAPSKVWYLAEGSSNWGLETWTLIENPNAAPADLTLTYMTPDGPARVSKVVPPRSRATYSMLSDIGEADASVMVTSSVPVVAERSMYRNSRREGSCSIGATVPSTDYFLAEGATGYDVGFKAYVLIQNPNEAENRVALTFQTGAGVVEGPAFSMLPNSRITVCLNDHLPENTDVSTMVHGTRPLVAERAMYWDNGTGEAFHASVGLPGAHMSFYLPDGQTSKGFETWTLVANPNPGAVRVRVTYLPQGGGKTVSFTDEIAPGTRATYDMAEKMGADARASILVESLDGARPVIAERSMYTNNRGAGTDTVGGFWR